MEANSSAYGCHYLCNQTTSSLCGKTFLDVAACFSTMPDAKLQWYSTLIFLFETTVGFADPITDLLTLVTFYRSDHKTWFAVGLVFLILPCFLHIFSE